MTVLSTHDPRPSMAAAQFFFEKMKSASNPGGIKDFEYYAQATVVFSRAVWQIINGATREYPHLRPWWMPINEKLQQNTMYMSLVERRNMTLKHGKLGVNPKARISLEGKNIQVKAKQTIAMRMGVREGKHEFWFEDAESGEEVTGTRTEMKFIYTFIDTDTPVIAQLAQHLLEQQALLDEFLQQVSMQE